MFSARPGTPAARASDQVPASEKTARLHVLQALLRDQQVAFNSACLGRTLPVLFAKPGRHPGQATGRSPYLQAVHITPPRDIGADLAADFAIDLIGSVRDVVITDTHTNSLSARLADADLHEPEARLPTATPMERATA
jgi:tRNA-2-methylthio-N6-dimethylallyladenosine synthase